MHLGIIGSGPSGAIAALRALRDGHQVTILDIGANVTTDKENIDQGRPPLKLIPERAFPYDLNNYTKVRILNGTKRWFASACKGGFSLVWGGTWKRFESLDSEEWTFAYSEVENLVKESMFNPLIVRGPEITNVYKDEQSTDSSTCNWNSKGISGFSRVTIATTQGFYNHQDSKVDWKNIKPWTSLQILLLCDEYLGFQYFEKFHVEHIVTDTNTVSCIGSHGQVQKFDKLLLAAGVFANLKILFASNLIEGPIELSDTRMVISPILGIRIKRNRPSSAFAQDAFETTLKVNGSDQSLHTQFYYHIDAYTENIASFVPVVIQKPLKKLLKMLSNHIALAITYLDDNLSSRLLVSFEDNELLVRYSECGKKSKDARKAIRNLSRILFNSRMFLLWPFSYHANPGDSYHVSLRNPSFINELGILNSDHKIGVSGGLGMLVNEPGPITFTLMAQSLLVSDEITKTLR